MAEDRVNERSVTEPVDYEQMVDMYKRALIHTLRKHSISGSFLDFWVPDTDSWVGITGMVDSARLAGLSDIAIRFLKSSVPAERLAELERTVSKLGVMTLDDQGDAFILKVSQFAKTSIDFASEEKAERAKPKYWKPDVAAAAAQKMGQVPTRWDDSDLPEFSDVHPHFRAPLKAALGTLLYEGEAKALGTDVVRATASEGFVTLTLDVEAATHKVKDARHTGGTKPSERAVMDLFCKAAMGLPVQEVADHAALKVLDLLIDDDKSPPVGGVLMPVNAGASFMLAGRLARKAYNNYCTQTGVKDGTNFYYPPPQAKWEGMTPEQRQESADFTLRAFLQSSGLYPDDISIQRIQKNKYGYEVRIIIGFSDRVPNADKPHLMRQLERRLRRDLEPEIDLVAERVKDSSPLRRLS